ncbi:MAG: hypothetical protein IJ809_06295 [Clostridia bacterium]|nr:hypothetical protein [Clostridia bacterium]
MENLTYERANIFDIISDEDVKIMEKLKKSKKVQKKIMSIFVIGLNSNLDKK